MFNEKKAIPTMATARIQRWALTLAAYHYSIDYKLGPEHAITDAPSQLPLPVSPPTRPLCAETVFTMELLDSTPVSVDEIRTATICDLILSQVIKYVQQSWPNHNSDEVFKSYFTRKHELSFEDGCLLWGNRVVVPPKARGRVVEELRDTPWNFPYEGVGEKLRVVADNGCRIAAESASVQSLQTKQGVTARSSFTSLGWPHKP